MQEALSNNVPVTGKVGGYTGTGAVDGTSYAVPYGRGNENRFIQISVTFSADPGAYVFAYQVSNDNINWTEQSGGSQITGTTTPGWGYFDSARFIRVNQVSKANAVTATALINLL